MILLDEDELFAIVTTIARKLAPPPPTFGIVVATDPLRVRFNAADDPAGVPIDITPTDYTPTVDDEVLLLRVGLDWACMGPYTRPGGA